VPSAVEEPRPISGYEQGVARLASAVEATAIATEGSWRARVSAALRTALDLLAADPALARLLLVDPLTARGEARLAHDRSIGRLAEALRPPPKLIGGEPVSDEILLLQAHGLVSYLSGRVLAGETNRLPELHEALLRYLFSQLSTGPRK